MEMTNPNSSIDFKSSEKETKGADSESSSDSSHEPKKKSSFDAPIPLPRKKFSSTSIGLDMDLESGEDSSNLKIPLKFKGPRLRIPSADDLKEAQEQKSMEVMSG